MLGTVGLFQEGVKAVGSEVKEEDWLAMIAIKPGVQSGGGAASQSRQSKKSSITPGDEL